MLIDFPSTDRLAAGICLIWLERYINDECMKCPSSARRSSDCFGRCTVFCSVALPDL
jgi:hypothetical protein